MCEQHLACPAAPDHLGCRGYSLRVAAGATVEEVKLWREAEVTHGRVAMLATVGFLAQEQAHFLFVEPAKDIGPAIRHLDEVRAVNPAFFELLTFTIGCCELYRALNGWIAPTSTEAGKVTLELPDGALRALRPDYYPGDVGFDPLNLFPTDAPVRHTPRHAYCRLCPTLHTWPTHPPMSCGPGLCSQNLPQWCSAPGQRVPQGTRT